ncbi:MAG: hypothetical protein KAS63_09695 [Candidatus Heimdallarchaeota archaeon]|nr:hypothetical protein [Candidatus Heimdallarchaeota archaeon]MCK4955623.1 hypothetical protein [Candidatus Heimdallarchaeota archaeon]
MEKEKQIYIGYKPIQLFSRGILAKKLELIGLPLSEAFEFSIKVLNELIKLDKENIPKDQHDEIVYMHLKETYNQKTANEFKAVEKWRESKKPLWIIIAGAIGVGKSTISRTIAGDLGIQHVVGTGVVRDILRKVLSAEIMPELHAPSYSAYESLRPIYSSRYEEVILGFENHSKFVNIGVEAVLSRAATEEVSIVVEGEHLLPAFFDEYFISKPNLLYVTISTPEESLHEENLSAQYTKEKDDLIAHFNDIRKIHEHLISETKIRKLPLIKSERGKNTIVALRKLVVEKIVALVSLE